MKNTNKLQSPIMFLTAAIAAILLISAGPVFAAPDAPAIISPTTNTIEMAPVTFEWTVTNPGTIASYSFLLDQAPDTVVNTPLDLITEQAYYYLAKGTYYFHVAAMDTLGTWGQTTHFQLIVNQTAFLLTDCDDGDESTPFIRDVVPLFEATGVDMYICGHYHVYERSYKNGIYYLITGAGGAPTHDVGWGDYTEFNQEIIHHCLVDAGDTNITVTAYDNSGNAFDTFVQPKGTTPAVLPPSTPTPFRGPPSGDKIYPYLQDVTKTSIKVMWYTETPLPSRVDYGISVPAGSFVEDLTPVLVHEIVLPGLFSGTTYTYKVTSGTLTSNNSTFKTAPADGSAFTFVAYGDNRADHAGAYYVNDHERVCNSIAGHNPETMMLHNGDFSSNGTDIEYQVQFFESARNLLNSIPLFPTIGNHEYHNPQNYEKYFEPPEIGGSGTELYYSFNYGNTHFAVIDTEQDCTVGSDQYNWLAQDLNSSAAQDAKWIIVSGHIPIYQSQSRSAPNGFEGDTGPFYEDDGSYCRLFYEIDPTIVRGGTGSSLRLDYSVPNASPESWAGIWIELDELGGSEPATYFGADLTGYNAVSFWVKGEVGGERFEVGLKDKYYFGPMEMTNETKVDATNYLESGVVTTSWQKVTIPFTAFTNIQRWYSMATFSITFLNSLSSGGRIYIDDIMFEIVQLPTISSPALLVDDFNDSNDSKNSLDPAQYTGGSGPGMLYFEEDPIHQYVGNLTNQARKIQYDCTTPGQYIWYASNLWDDVTYYDISDYDYLTFRVKRVAGNEDCKIEMQHSYNSKPIVYLRDYARDTTDWQTINIPLSDFVGLDKTRARGISMVVAYDDAGLLVKAGTLWLDNLQLSPGYAGYGKPESMGVVRIERDEGSLYVNNDLFYVRGAVYQPTPINGSPPPPDDAGIYERDFSILEQAGFNTVIIPELPWTVPYTNLMSKASEHGIKIIAGFRMDGYANLSDPAIRDDFTAFVTAYANLNDGFPIDKRPILMWAIGSQGSYSDTLNPASTYASSSNNVYYELCNELGDIAYQLEGGEYHPVMIANRHLHNIGVSHVSVFNQKSAEDLQLGFIDVWGAEAYHTSFANIDWYGSTRDFFELYNEKSSKPLIITKYGADAYNTLTFGVDEDAQAGQVLQNTLEIIDASNIALGGCVMEYSDEWHMSVDPSNQDTAPVLWSTAYLPDGYLNNEYLGMVQIAPDGTWDTANGIDDVRVRKAHDVLKSLFTTPPDADFTGVPTEGEAPLTVQFTDTSTSIITSWSWDFGDGGTSTEQNPVYDYNNSGMYTVSLTVSGPFGTDTETKENYIVVPTVVTDVEELVLAIDESAPGHTIVMEPNTYTLTEDLIIEKGIRLVGLDPITTTIVLDENHLVIRYPMLPPGSPPMEDPLDVTIEGMTIAGHIYTGLRESYGSAPIQNYGGKLTFQDCRVVDNEGVMVSAIYNTYYGELHLKNTLIARNVNLATDDVRLYGGHIDYKCYSGTIYLGTMGKLYMENSTIADNVDYSQGFLVEETGYGETGYGETGYGETGYGETGYGKSVIVEYGAIQCVYSNYLNILDSIMWYNGKTADKFPDISNVFSINQTRDIANLVTRQQTIPGTGSVTGIIPENPEFIIRYYYNYNPSNPNCIGLGSYLPEGIPPTEPQPPPPPPPPPEPPPPPPPPPPPM